MSSVVSELIKTAINKWFKENKDDKHKADAKFGWERCDVYFVIPVINDKGEVVRKNNYVLMIEKYI